MPVALAHPTTPSDYDTNPDDDAFSELYTIHRSELCRFASTIVRPDVAEDVVQDVFARLWERWSDRTLSGEPRRYLYRAVRYRAIDHLRHQEVVERWRRHQTTTGSDVHPLIFLHPAEELHTQEFRQAVDDALKCLPRRRRRMFNLSRRHGMTYAEIASMMGVSVKTVERQISRSLKSLRSYLTEYVS